MGAPGENRTPDALLRTEALCPLSYGGGASGRRPELRDDCTAPGRAVRPLTLRKARRRAGFRPVERPCLSPSPGVPSCAVCPRAVLVSAALLLSACGGGSDETSAAGSGDGASGGVLKVATEGTYAPFSFHRPGDNALIGYDIEVVEAVAEELGVEVEFSETQFDAIFAGLEAKRYDVIANQVTVTDERTARYVFSAALHGLAGVVVTRADDRQRRRRSPTSRARRPRSRPRATAPRSPGRRRRRSRRSRASPRRSRC